ncbi:hypothetical protein ACQ4LE_003643 [Meloidogyne hapla]
MPDDLKQFCATMNSAKNNRRYVLIKIKFKINLNLFQTVPEGSRDLPDDRPELRCINLSCICPAFNGKSNGSENDCTLPNGKKLEKCVRKEYRMLTDEERETYSKTVRQIKENKDFDIAAVLHKQAWDDGGAHNGPSFLPWHREFLKVYELMLREAAFKSRGTPDVCLPYWDSTLEKQLPTQQDSYFFTAAFIGSTNANGEVIDGPFAPWETLQNTDYIGRTVGQHASCYVEERFKWQMEQTDIANIIAYSNPPEPPENCPYGRGKSGYPEYAHGGVHTFIGGLMAYPGTSANDPVFHNHHCFIDCLYELWRKGKQNYTQRPVEYPTDRPECSTPIHYRNQNMSQFPYIKNIDGCRNEYTDNMYEYAPRPTCSYEKPDCGSKYLFCDLSKETPHCAAKVRPGGDCKGFTKGEQVCYNSICVNNVCVGHTTLYPTTTLTTRNPPTISSTTQTQSTTVNPTTQAPSTEAPTQTPSTTVTPTTQTPSTEAPTTQTPSTEAPTTLTPTTTVAIYYTQAPSTAAPTTLTPSTAVPTTQTPSTTVTPTTQTPSTEAPTTQTPSTTVTPTTQTPSTEAPTTQTPSTTVTPTTQTPSTEAPTTQTPSTAAPTTQTPSTEAPTTQTPSTTMTPTIKTPSTEAPTTQTTTSTVVPTTQTPSTASPTTETPSTAAPTTQNPSTTVVPTTQTPSTASPTTETPSTAAPTTQNPSTTVVPTTQTPSTAAPTTEAPTTEAPTSPTQTTSTTKATTTECDEPYDCEDCY